MADDLRRLEIALINADKAGDTEAAKVLAARIRELGGLQVPDDIEGAATPLPPSQESIERREQKQLEETTGGRFQVAATEPFEDLQGNFEALLNATGLENVPSDRQRNFIEKLPKQLLQGVAGVATIAGATAMSGLNLIGQGIEELTGAPREDSTEFIEMATIALGNPAALRRVGAIKTPPKARPQISARQKTDEVFEQPARPQIEAPKKALEGDVLPPLAEKAGQKFGEGFTRLNEKIDRVFPPEEKAQSLLRDTLKLDKIEAGNIRQMTKDFEARNGRTPTLLEISGENIEGLARKSGGEIGESRSIIEAYRTNVLEGQTQLVRDIAERTLVSPDKSFSSDIKALETQMQRQAKPLYDEAFSQTVRVNKKIKGMLSSPSGKQAVNKAIRILRQEGKGDQAKQLIALKNRKTVTPDNVSVEALDAIKRGFDDIIESKRDKVTRRLDLDQFGRATNKTRADFRNAIDELSPVYAEARQAFAGPATLKDAMEAARNAAKKPSVTADQIRTRMKDMTASEKEFYRSGFMKGLQDVMEKPAVDVNRVRKLVHSEGLVKKLGAVFDDPKLAAEFVEQLKEAEKLSGRVQRVSPSVGTVTAQRGADTASFNAMSKTEALKNVVQSGYNKMRQNRNIRNDQLVNKDIAELLTQPLTDDVLEQIAKRLQENK